MSNRIAKARAEAGIIFRDGKLWKREEWEKHHNKQEVSHVHPKQSEVDTAIDELKKQRQGVVIVKDGRVLDPKDTDAVMAEATAPYFCTKCNKNHTKGKIHTEHIKYRREYNG